MSSTRVLTKVSDASSCVAAKASFLAQLASVLADVDVIPPDFVRNTDIVKIVKKVTVVLYYSYGAKNSLS